MSLSEALHAARFSHDPRGGVEVPCTMCVIITSHSGDERVTLEEAAAGKISGRALHGILRAEGIRIDRAVIRRHRNEAHRP